MQVDEEHSLHHPLHLPACPARLAPFSSSLSLPFPPPLPLISLCCSRSTCIRCPTSLSRHSTRSVVRPCLPCSPSPADRSSFDETVEVDEDKDRKLAQSTFASLALVDRTANRAATPWLYRRPFLEENTSRKQWERTYKSKISPWSLCGIQRGSAIGYKPEEVRSAQFHRFKPADGFFPAARSLLWQSGLPHIESRSGPCRP
jgi:hypothetical protein